MTQPQHEDPWGEARQQLLQGLVVLATVGEAAARWRMVGPPAAATRPVPLPGDGSGRGSLAGADSAQRARAARLIAGLDFGQAATVWRAAAATGNPDGGVVVGLAQDRLRVLHPRLMDAYDRHRAAGLPAGEAMRTVARQAWRYPARAHDATGQRPALRPGVAALPPGGSRVEEWDAAVRAEAARLAPPIAGEALRRWQQAARDGGRVPAADGAGLVRQMVADAVHSGLMAPAAAWALERDLDAHADRQYREATQDRSRVDLAATARDEHAEGLAAAQVGHGSADRDHAAAMRQRMSVAFPHEITVTAMVAAAAAAKRPVPVLTRGRTR